MKILEFQAIKFILFVLILLHHLECFPGGGNMAVSVFFMLSGFSYTLGYKDKISQQQFQYKAYLKRKFKQFYPMHWGLLIIAALLIVSKPFNAKLVLAALPFNLALLQSWIPFYWVYFSYNSLTWFLSDLVFFIAIFPWLLRWMLQQAVKSCIITLLLASFAYGALCIFTPKEMENAVFYIHPLLRLYDFSIGVAMGLVFQHLLQNKMWMQKVNQHTIFIQILGIFFFGSLLVVALFWSTNLHAVIYWPASILFILSIALTSGKWKVLNSAPLLWLGKYAFVFYMTHQLIIRIIERFIS